MSTNNINEQEKIDAVLDAALDELDDDEEECKIATTRLADEMDSLKDVESNGTVDSRKSSSKSSELKESPNQSNQNDEEEILSTMMQTLFRGEEGSSVDAALGKLLQSMQEETNADTVTSPAGSSPKKEAQSKDRTTTIPKQNTTHSSDEVGAAIANLLDGMARHTKENENYLEEDDDNDAMKGMFGGLGDVDADALIDGMMEQLVSKELMYEPMAQVAAKFPSWLESNKDKLSAEEFQSRSAQCKYFQQLVHTYETDPHNTSKLMGLMQQVQEYGQPPSDIIQEIAPGLELDANGMPKLDTNDLPNGDEECRIM